MIMALLQHSSSNENWYLAWCHSSRDLETPKGTIRLPQWPQDYLVNGIKNNHLSNCNSDQAQAFDPSEHWELKMQAVVHAHCRYQLPAHHPIVCGKNTFWNEKEANIFEKSWKSDSEPHHPKSDFSGQRGLNFLLKSWQSSSLSGRRKETLQNFSAPKMVKKSM